MILSGLQKSTLIDYPGQIAAVVFTAGCNLRCGFCHNPEMVLPKEIQAHASSHIQENIFFHFLERRRGILDGVSICGGEPTIHRDLPEFCRKIKSMGFSVKLDTNGRDPDMIARLIDENLVDYFAMDIKHTWEKYESLVGTPFDARKYQESVKIIQTQAKDYEFRTTIIWGVHREEDIREMASSLWWAKIYYLQNYRSGTTLDPEFSGHSLYEKELDHFRDIALQYVTQCEIRN